MADEEAGDATKAAAAKKKKMMMIGIIVAVLGAGGYYFMGMSSASSEPVKPTPGEVVTAESMHINLADGHFLKLQLALQVIEGPAHAPDPAMALDAAIDLFSGQPIADVQSAKGRQKYKEKLVEKLDKLYHHDVMDVYFIQYVVQ